MKNKELAPFDEFKNQLIEFDNKYKDVVYNLSDAKENKQARSDKFAIGKICSKLALVHKDIKAPYLVKCNEIDDLKKSLENGFRATQKDIGEQIKKHDAEIQAHKDFILGKVKTIDNFLADDNFLLSSDALAKKISDLELIEVDESYEHLEGFAVESKSRVLKRLKFDFDIKLKAEQDEAELILLRRKQAEQDKLNHDKEVAENAVKQAQIDSGLQIKRVEQEKIEAVAQAKAEAKAEAEAIEKTRIYEARVAEVNKTQAEAKEKERISNIEHRKTIHTTIKHGILKSNLNLTEADAIKVVKAIIAGNVPNLTINY